MLTMTVDPTGGARMCVPPPPANEPRFRAFHVFHPVICRVTILDVVVPLGTVERSQHELLLVEDNPADIRLFKLAVEESDVRGSLRTAPNGERALSILETDPIDLVILDIDLPARSGLDVLRELNAAPDHGATPVLILSTSDDPDEVREAYRFGANAYMVKRMDFQDTVALVDALDEFWLHTAELPD
ncbi:response regulator [Halobacteriales archaeon QS_4_70_19]|nr:MAG: response regulator [Halobacteriales archaeon QS_4_70_19]